jgi:hypothetical protein
MFKQLVPLKATTSCKLLSAFDAAAAAAAG